MAGRYGEEEDNDGGETESGKEAGGMRRSDVKRSKKENPSLRKGEGDSRRAH